MKTVTKRLRVAVVGCGKIADGHVEEIKKIPSAELIAVCDVEPLMAEQLAVRSGTPLWYADLDELLRAQQIDVVHITTPPQFHLPVARKAVAAGAHVLVEKPIAPTLDETEDLIRTVTLSGRKLTVNYWPNFEKPAEQLKRLVSSGTLGDIVHIESFYGYNFSGAYGQALLADREHWVHRLPGGVFENVFDHVVNKIVPLFPQDRVQVETAKYSIQPNGMPDELRVLLRCGSTSAYATVSGNARPVGHFLRVYGTKNSVHADFNARTLVIEPQQTFPSALGRLFPPFIFGRRYLGNAFSNCADFMRSRSHFFAGMNRLFSLFYASILNDTDVPIPVSDMRRVSEIMDSVFAARVAAHA